MMRLQIGRGVCLVALATLALAACNDHPVYQAPDPCPNGGEKVSQKGKDYCAFVITETGFLCPETLPHGYRAEGDGDEIGVCSADAMEDPNDIQRVARKAVEDGSVGGEEVDSNVTPPSDENDGPDGGFVDVGAADAGADGPPPLDIIWIVDNSGSMCEEQASIREAAAAFIAPLVEAGVDFQIGVITTDVEDAEQSGRLRTTFDGEPGPSCTIQVDTTGCPAEFASLLTSEAYAGRADELERDFGCLVTQGTAGYGFEAGLQAAYLATTQPHLSGANRGVIRDGADLALVFLSDENDCSERGALDLVNGNVCEWEADKLVLVSEYAEHFRDLKAGNTVLVATIVAPDIGQRYAPPTAVVPTCTSPSGEGYAGWRYEQFAAEFALNWGQDICTSPYDISGLGAFLNNR